MKKAITLLLAVLMWASIFAGCEGGTSSENGKLADVKFDAFAVGFGKADITPDPTTQIGIIGMNDTTTRLSTAVEEPLGATCVAFTDTDGTTVIVFGADLHGSNDEVVQQIRDGIEEKTGVPGEHVQFNTSHNHYGPDQGSTATTAVQVYNEMMISRCIQAAVDALESRKPAQMYTTFCRPENLVFTRHYLGIDGTYIGSGAGSWPTNKLLGHMEKGDNLMQLVKFTREGEKDIILVNWQGHYKGTPDKSKYTTLLGDYSAVMRRILLERADCESVFIYGASGDSVASSRIPEEKRTKDYIEHGTVLAEEAIAAFDTFQPAETGKIYFQEEKYVLPFPNQEKGWIVSAFGFGDFAFTAEPFETFQTNGMAVKENSPWTMTFYASISNANKISGYVPDAFALTYACYERGPMFTPEGTGEVLEAKQLEMLSDLFEQSGQTKKEKPEGYIMDHSPKSNGRTYTNPGTSIPYAVNNGHYQVQLLEGPSLKTFLVKDRELAENILSRDTVELLFNEQNMVVGIAE